MLGNPPYYGYAGVESNEEQGLLEPYRTGLKEWGITKNYLNDLYIRFFRIAERRVAERTGRGVVCFISNFSYLDDASYVVVRERFLEQFDAMWFDVLNGSSRETGKRTPTGEPDPSVFSTKLNRAGIRVGTAIGLFVRRSDHTPAVIVRKRDFWGKSKREDLVQSLGSPDINSDYAVIVPDASTRYSFRSAPTATPYAAWPALDEISSVEPMLGLNERSRAARSRR